MIKKNKHGGKRKRAGRPKGKRTTQVRTSLDTFLFEHLPKDKQVIKSLITHFAIHEMAGHGVFIFDKEKDFLI